MIMYKKLLKLIATLSIFPIFLTIRMDPDMWWHLRLGKEIIEKNTFGNNLTYTCSQYTWINHSWLSDVVMYWVEKNLGFTVLSFLFFLITILGVYFNYKTFEYFLKQQSLSVNSVKRFFFIIISYVILMGFLAIRPQIITFVFVSILFNRLIKIYYEKVSNLDILSLVILFILWPNLHGGFIIGYALIGLFIFGALAKLARSVFVENNAKVLGKYIKEIKKFSILLLITLPLSLINAFGLDAWKEVFNNLFNSQNSNYINEWSAINLKQQYGLLFFLLFISILILMILNKKINFLRISLLLIFGLLSLYTVRYILVAVPIVSIVFCLEFISFYSNFKKITLQDDISKYVRSMFLIIPYIFIAIIIVGSLLNLVSWYSSLSKNTLNFSTYPYDSVEFLKNNPEYSKLNFLNDYGWGGYLSWTMQESKWFIDGRMAVWPCGEVEDSVLKDYIEMEALNSDWKKVMEHYNIEGVIMKSNARLVNVLKEDKEWEIIFENTGETILVKKK